MSFNRREFLRSLAGSALMGGARARGSAEWRVGLAAADITPPAGVWMAGYAARLEPSKGCAQPLHAKALAVVDREGRRAVIVTLDVLGLTAPVVERVAAAIRRRHHLSRAELLLCSSHTHCGPVIDDQLSVAYDLTPGQWELVRAATRRVEEQVVHVVGQAIDRVAPARLRSSQGTASFAANRRLALNPHGPIDPSVPVLAVQRPDGTLAGLVFGHACHNTTLPATFVRYHGDYAGVAQAELESRHPGATALYIAGCGADANPAPRGTLELAERHGRALADAVDASLAGAAEIGGRLSTAFATATLPYMPAPDADEWRQRLGDENVFVRRHASLMLDELARAGRNREAEAAPVHVIRIGTLPLVGISGEVVVDYALAVKQRHGTGTWVAGYTDVVFGYLPSLRVLREGGYEGGDAMLYYARPGPFSEVVERRVMGCVDDLMAQTAPSR